MGIISIKMLIMNILLRRGFESLDIKVIRFSNLDILRNFQEVCEMIHMEVKNRTTQSL